MLLRPPLQSPLMRPLRSPLQRALGFSPVVLFASGEQGAWYDPSDFSTMFQDSAGSTPVTAPGQPVGKINDKSGRGNHLTQATAANRPTLEQDGNGKYYLNCDGVNDGMASASIDFTATNKMTVWAGVHKTSDAAIGVAFELTVNSGSTNGAFGFLAPDGAGLGTYKSRVRGTVGANERSASGYAAPITNVVSQSLDTAAGTVPTQNAFRINGVAVGTGGAVTTAGNFANAPFHIGVRSGGTFPFSGRIYGLIVRGAASSDTQIAQAERWMAARTGVSI